MLNILNVTDLDLESGNPYTYEVGRYSTNEELYKGVEAEMERLCEEYNLSKEGLCLLDEDGTIAFMFILTLITDSEIEEIYNGKQKSNVCA